ncbi:MAG: hypothetical protein JXB05_28060 [Myxococcaceae bacterium]|nr:hypothetical protein [Myxococcaceae bacterium]
MSDSFLVRCSCVVLSVLLLTTCGEHEGGRKAPSVTALNHETHTDFPIATGVHALADCNTCHGEFDTFKEFNCVSCHDHAQEVTDPTHVRVADYSWSGTRCYECHPDGTATAVNHTSFPIGAGTIHTGITCATCHTDRTNRKVVDCIGCHTHSAAETDAIHNGIANYAWTSPKCLECHPQGNITGVDHTAWFPTEAGTSHGGISCRQCHPTRANRKVLDCVTCHTAAETDPEHSQVGGYARDSARCVRCHGDSQVHSVSGHTPFSIRQGTGHFRTSCLECHPVSRTDKPWAQDFDPFDCLSCHSKGAMDDKHQNFATYRYESATCVNSGCHQNGDKP